MKIRMGLKPLYLLNSLNPFTEVNGNKKLSLSNMILFYCRQL